MFNSWTTPFQGTCGYEGVAIAGGNTRTYYGCVSASTSFFTLVQGSTTTNLPAPPDNGPIASALDMLEGGGNTSYDLHVIQRDSSGRIVHQVYYQPSTPSFWQPAGREIAIGLGGDIGPSMSPTICARSDVYFPTLHAAILAGGNLWYAHSGTYVTGSGDTTSFNWSGWERISSDTIVSSPDCSVTSSDVVSVVARKNDGTIVRVYGSSGSWVTENLGTY